MPHRLARLKNPFYVIPFEVGFGIYLILNGLLTLSAQSTVLSNLLIIMGTSAFILPVIQVLSGIFTIIGIGSRRANLEAGGLILSMAVLMIRAIAIFHDGPPHLDDMNALVIITLLIYAATTRLNHILIVNNILNQSEERTWNQ